jgi:hypothetical protein
MTTYDKGTKFIQNKLLYKSEIVKLCCHLTARSQYNQFKKQTCTKIG